MAAGPLVFEGFERGEMQKRTLLTASAVLFGLGLLLSTKKDSIWFKLSPELRKTVRLFFAMCKKDGPERPR